MADLMAGMAGLSYQQIQDALGAQPLFENKTWRLSPEPFPLTRRQIAELEQIGQACLDFYLALDSLYRRCAEGKNLLRNKELVAPWVCSYLDRGKPRRLVEHARLKQFKGQVPLVLRPDLLVTEEGFALTEMDSVPGGLGLTAFLNRLYGMAEREFAPDIVGGVGQVELDWRRCLAATKPNVENPLIAVIVSDEAAVYRPEFDYLTARLREQGLRVYARHPDDLMPMGDSLCIPVDGNPEDIDIIYRFWELFDVGNVSTAKDILRVAEDGGVIVSPPMKAYQEEKLNLALLHHPVLDDYWRENLPRRSYKTLKKVVPHSWIIDPVELPPNAVLDAPWVDGKPIREWEQLAEASQKERNLIIKASGFHETAWGARSVTLGSDSSKTDWQEAIETAVDLADETLHILQDYRKPIRLKHPVYSEDGGGVYEMDGRLRLTPYFFVEGDQAKMSACLATFCPADKKIIHGMKDAAMLPCRVVD